MDRTLATRGVVMKRKLTENLTTVRGRIAEAATKAGRDPSDVTLVAVTKTVDLEVVRTLLELGQCDLGESRVQQLIQRAGMIHEHLGRRAMLEQDTTVPDPKWHMIGHLQRNKVKVLLPVASVIHSVDTLRLAEEINSQAGKQRLRADVLLEVNCSGEAQKHGMPVAAVGHVVEQILSLPNLRIWGLMAMAPLTNDSEASRPVFDRLYELFLEVKMQYRLGAVFCHVSMGMSQDYAVAVECGATMVRVGTAIFDGIEGSGT